MLPKSGTITTTQEAFYTPEIGKTGNIFNIKYNNTANTPWDLEVYQFNIEDYSLTLLYKVSLLAGQMINDDANYIINDKCSLQAVSSVNTISFVINGVES